MVSAMAMRTLAILAFVVSVPVASFGQPAIGGTVSDPSGAPVAGVLVEASSIALIEKTRKTLTDTAGRYRMEDLVPGTYRVRFTLQGWKPYQQEGVELTGSFTAAVNAELVVGRERNDHGHRGNPGVDVQSAGREMTLSGDVVQSIPTARSYNALLVAGPRRRHEHERYGDGHGGDVVPHSRRPNNEGRLSLDGFNVGSPPSGNQRPATSSTSGNAQEVTFTTSGGLGESETAGLVMNIVPKTGGNTMHGSFFVSGTGEELQSDNLTPELLRARSTAPTPLTEGVRRIGDARRSDREGSAVVFRQWRTPAAARRTSANVYYNLNAGDPDEVAVCARPQPPRVLGPDVRERQRPPHLAGRRRATRSAASGTRRRCAARARARRPAWRNPRACRPRPSACSAGRSMCRRRHGRRPSRIGCSLEAGFGGTYFGVGNFERDPNPTRGSDSRRRAVRERVRGERQHSRAGLSIAGLQRRAHRLVPVEGIGRRTSPARTA